MALFKISRGSKTGLENNKPNIKDGNAYFTTDDGKFYIDVGTSETDTSAAVYGNTTEHPDISNANRICINPISQTDFNTLDTKVDKQVDAINSSITDLQSSKADDFLILNCGDASTT